MDENIEGTVSTAQTPIKHKTAYFVPALIVVFLCILLSLCGFYFRSSFSSQPPHQTKVCLADAKLCPDGSSVAREAPNCEFASCPTIAPTMPITPALTDNKGIPSNWKSEKNIFGSDLSIQYPPTWYVDGGGSMQFPYLQIQNYPIDKTGQNGGERLIKGYAALKITRFPGATKAIVSLNEIISLLPKEGDSSEQYGAGEDGKLVVYTQEKMIVNAIPILKRITGPKGHPEVKTEEYFFADSNGDPLNIVLFGDVASQREIINKILSSLTFIPNPTTAPEKSILDRFKEWISPAIWTAEKNDTARATFMSANGQDTTLMTLEGKSIETTYADVAKKIEPYINGPKYGEMKNYGWTFRDAGATGDGGYADYIRVVYDKVWLLRIETNSTKNTLKIFLSKTFQPPN